ncbi:AmiS/UreI family transporter [Helicobacter trogontum]|uniref:AmiS/UreI family transporter n=1 Tax=Helicobacter trogontum TaxID=50960 RepID=UPI002A915802|nr:AmiS/UreI family transporter [Helicobacter trogontum]MDY5185005.1 AmiS/UreI family transporter [Helicobacter trogontum]
MLGLILLYVAIVLISNGICRISNINGKTTAVMNIFVGLLSVVVNIIAIIQGEFYAAATGLLFGFTYLFIACNILFNLDLRAFGWYSLFVTINSIPAAYLSYKDDVVHISFTVIWLAWGVLWLTGFIECVLKIELKFVPYLAIFEGILTAWIPAWLLLTGVWRL